MAVDPKLCALHLPLRIVALGINTAATAVLRVRNPTDHKTPTRQRYGAGGVLTVRGRSVDPELCALRLPLCVVALGIDAPAAAVLAVRLPTGHKTPVGQRRDAGGRLITAGGAVDPELCALHLPLRVVALGINTAATAVLGVRNPADHNPPTRQRRDAGGGLITAGAAVDPELAAEHSISEVDVLDVLQHIAAFVPVCGVRVGHHPVNALAL